MSIECSSSIAGALIADGSLAALRALARLPIKISLRATGGEQALGPEWQRQGDGKLTRFCEPHEKIAAIKAIAPLLEAEDNLEIEEPSLDDLYAHFLGPEAES